MNLAKDIGALKDLNVLVTGGAGFIGSHLVDILAKKASLVIVIDNLSTGDLKNIKNILAMNNNVKFIKADLKNRSSIKNLLKEIEVEVVFHLAANPNVKIGAENPQLLFEENVVATENLLEALLDTDVKYFVFTSSSTVYGEPDIIPTPEEYAPLKPISIYGGTKLANEAMISGFSHTFGFRSLILRLANVIGPRTTHGVVYDFVKKLRSNPFELEILGDGKQKKSYIYINDVINAVLLLFEKFYRRKKRFEIYNIGNEDWITVSEIAKIVSDVMGLSPKFIYINNKEGRGWKGDVRYMLLDISKAKDAGWKPVLTSREAVRKTAEWLKENMK